MTRFVTAVLLTVAPALAWAGAAETYTAMCSTCHGATGAGDGAAAVALTPKPANFTDPAFWKDKTDDVVAKAIKEGGPAVGKSALMAPFGAALDDAAIKELVTYLRTMEKKAG